MRKKNFSTKEIETIFRLKSLDYTWKYIGEILDSSPDVVKNAFKRVNKKSGLPPKEKRSKSTVNGRLAGLAKRIVWSNPQISYRAIPGEVRLIIGKDQPIPGYKAFERFLKKSNFKRVKLLKKPLLSEVNRLKRLSFVENFSEKHPDFWDYVIWSDETMVRSCPKSKDVFFKVNTSVCREDLPVNPQVQTGGFSVMFWGCFSRMGLGPLVALEENLNATTYIELLETALLPELEAVGVPMVFMQDNAPCHKAKVVTQFLARNNVETLPWPPQSPDMNPIENLWAIIKARLKDKFQTPKTRDELIEQVFTIWNDIGPELYQILSDSIFHRLYEVSRRNGRQTKF